MMTAEDYKMAITLLEGMKVFFERFKKYKELDQETKSSLNERIKEATQVIAKFRNELNELEKK
jgi:hypothetical protein